MVSENNIVYVGGSGGNFLAWCTVNALKYDTIPNPADSHNEYFVSRYPHYIQCDHPEDLVNRQETLSEREGYNNFVITIPDLETAQFVKQLLTVKKQRTGDEATSRVVQNAAVHFIIWSKFLLTVDRLNPVELDYKRFFIDREPAYIKGQYTNRLGFNEQQYQIFARELSAYYQRNVALLQEVQHGLA
jgi:hypothetical protein